MEEPNQIGGYHVIRRLGSGGMGTVYEAEDRAHGRRVAVKVIKPQVAASPDNLERFRQEGRLASLISHPRCVFVYQADEEEGRPYIVMELMPGATLKDIVTQQGPLQVGQAIAKILDVIDGLQAAHHIGVIHRDVKPSNCFVLTDGHVKVGDFGLSKFLPGGQSGEGKQTSTPQPETTPPGPDAVLTRTGTFVGTPLFASPEQIKGETVDFRTDIYSVSATLYYLLCGHAPFEGGDNTATIARIVSEEPVSLRAMRPEIPAELDRVVMHGLERQRESRCSSLVELKQALLPFLPGFLQNSPRPTRIRAALVDIATLTPILLLITQIIFTLMPEDRWGNELIDMVTDLAIWVIVLGYYVVTEVIFGASFGKWLLRLRVGGTRPGKPPKRRQLLLRALGFFVIVALPGLLGFAITGSHWVKWILHGAGFLLLFDSMRARGGFRGLHEVLSGTCVVQVPQNAKSQTFPILPPRTAAPLPPNMPKKIGNYVLQGIHRVLDDRIFLEGTDLVLERPVWLVLRPLEEGKIAPARRDLSRGTRLRWLGGGDIALESRSKRLTHHWDAFIAPVNGCSVTTLVALNGRLSWADARPILLQLSQELSVALTDGTFPDELGPDQLWLQPDGQLMIIGARFQSSSPTLIPDAETDLARSMLFLRQTAALMFEGKMRDPKQTHRIQAPLPGHAHELMRRLFATAGELFRTPKDFFDALQATAEKPAEVTSSMRLGQVLLLSALLSPILLAILILGRFYRDIQPSLLVAHQIKRAEALSRWLGDDENLPIFMTYLQFNPTEFLHMRRHGLLDMMSHEEFKVLPRHTKEKLLMLACQGQIKGRLKQDLKLQTDLMNKLSFAAILPYSYAFEFLPTTGNSVHRQGAQTGADPHQRVYQDLYSALRHAQSSALETDEPLPLYLNRPAFQIAIFIIGSWFLLWVIWSALTRGGLSLRLMGFDLQTSRGRMAGPLLSGWRTFLLWLPFFSLLLLSIYAQEPHRLNAPWIQWGLWWLAVIYLAGCGICALIWSKRGLHDVWSGVYLMPR